MQSYPKAALSTLEALYRLGKEICEEVETLHPDVVIGLAHSGWLPVVAAQVLWAETNSVPFPAATRSNIGHEKYNFYKQRFGTYPPAFCCGECSWDGSGRLGHYLAWVAEQKNWGKTLQQQIKKVFKPKPRRVLIVDDLFGGYRSGFATLALIEETYPGVEVYIYAGHNDLTDALVTAWLVEFIPELGREVEEVMAKITNYVRYGSPWQETFKSLVTGTEDVTDDSLEWRPISRDSAAVKAAQTYVPVETALSAPEWTVNLVRSYILQRLRDEIAQDTIVEPPEDMDHFVPIMRFRIDAKDRLAARAWRRNGVTNTDIEQIYGNNPEAMDKGLREVRVDWAWFTHQDKPSPIYFPYISYETWITAYDQVDSPVPVKGFAEFSPDEIWAGAYPIALDENIKDQPYRDLLSNGVNLFVDLTNPSDAHRRMPYQNSLFEISREMKMQVEIENIPLPFRAAPSRMQVQRVLRRITRARKQGRMLYVHAGQNLEGRTPLILACLLVEQGMSAQKAMQKVDAFWLDTLHYLICSPLSAEQRKFILNWKRER